MAFSGHRATSMLKRYEIISLDDLRAAAARASEYVQSRDGMVIPLRAAENTDSRIRG